MPATFDPACRRCRRLAAHLAAVREQLPEHHNGPVDGFGARHYRLLVVGLAPGLHGANRTGRAFTGDASGALLFHCLHQAGIASAAAATARGDGLRLRGARITNAVKCLPPGNRPLPAEIERCAPFLAAEMSGLAPGGVVLALGALAHRAVLRALGARPSRAPFRHGAMHLLDRTTVFDSYHCSRLNVNTGRLTEPMLQAVIDAAAAAARRGPA